MITYLLDVNVLIALLDPNHVHHERAHSWFAQIGHTSWATCPFTQAAVPRILGNPRYPNSLGTPSAVMPFLQDLCAHPGHSFWSADISILDEAIFDTSRLLDFGQVTDSYLLALSVAHEGQLATLDRRLITEAVAGGKAGLCVIA